MPRSVVYALRSVLGVRVPPSTLYGCFIYSKRGYLLCLFFAMAVVGQIVKQAEVKHPRFSFCSQP
jgi:hypothetical protein